MSFVRLPALWGAVLLAAAVLPAMAHEGHDHGAAPVPQSVVSAPRAEVASDAVEVVVVARGGELEVYVDDFRTNAPIEGAAVEVETSAGPVSATAGAGGSYRLAAPWAMRPGRHDLVVTVMFGTVLEVLPVTLVVPEAVAGVPAATFRVVGVGLAGLVGGSVAVGVGFGAGVMAMWLLMRRRVRGMTAAVLALVAIGWPAHAQDNVVVRDQAQRLPDGTVFVPKASQRILALRTEMTGAGRHARTVELPGRVIPDPDASGYVQAAIGGRLSAPAGGFPRLGAAVRAGEVLALVTPPFQAIDSSNIRQQASEIDQQVAIVERRLARLRTLGDVAPRSQAEDAQTELRGLRERRAGLDQVRREPEPLVAPIDGVVAASTAAAGRIADPGTVVFQIVDPRRLWVEALQFEAMGEPGQASARLIDGRTAALVFRGAGLIGVGQAIPLHFAVAGDAAGLRVGQLVTVVAQTDAAQDGLALPRAAVLRGQSGVAIVYEHSGAERFRPHEVRTVALDGERVLVVAGIGPGLRIVTQGAELLNQIR